MGFRYMRLICYFDLPTFTSTNRRNYRKFRQWLIREGFVMVQQSVYSKLCLNGTAAKIEIDRLERHKPQEGNVMLTLITEKQFASTVFLVGNHETEYVTTTDRMVVL